MNSKDEVRAYFAAKAADYDEVDRQRYWMLSDALLWWLLEREVVAHLPHTPSLLDAGAGTGRWSAKVLAARSDAHATLVDLSPDMLAEARTKLEVQAPGRFTASVADLDSFRGEPEHDLVLCLHNVIGFVDDPRAVVSQLLASLKPGGHLVLATPNWYHALYFALSVGDVGLAQRIHATHKAWFGRDMPGMHAFTPEELRAMVPEEWEARVFGFPVSLYPGMEETRLFGETESLGSLLGAPSAVQAIMDIEKEMCLRPDVSARGNQLLLIARRPA